MRPLAAVVVRGQGTAFELPGHAIEDHFADVGEMARLGPGSRRRFPCHSRESGNPQGVWIPALRYAPAGMTVLDECP